MTLRQMTSLQRSAGTVLLVIGLCLGTSAGPAFGTDNEPPAPAATAEPIPASVPVGSTTVTTTTQPETTSSPETTTSPEATTQPEETTQPETTTPLDTSQPEATTPAETVAEIAEAASESVSDEPDVADLRLSVWFDKPAYLGHEEITVHAAVANVGTAAVNQVTVTSTGNLSGEWQPFFPSGYPIGPGQTVEGSLTGMVTTTESTLHLAVTAGSLGNDPDANPADNTVTVSVPITFVRGNYRGTVYQDRNANHAMDPGEEFAGVGVQVSGGHPYTIRTAVTGADGRFAVLDLPAGKYTAWFGNPWWDDWYVPTQDDGYLDGTRDLDVLVRATPRIMATMSGSLAFNQPAYRVNDVAHLTLSLTNGGPWPVDGVVVRGYASDLGQVDAGALTEGGPGVLIPSGSTRTFDLTIRITERARYYGYLGVSCVIGAPSTWNNGPFLDAVTRVPGGFAPLVVGTVSIFRYKPGLGAPVGDPLPGVTLYLRSQVTGAVVARAISGDGGGFTFSNLPADLYTLGVVGPWKIVSGTDFVVHDGENGPPNNPGMYEGHHIFVLPGPDQPDPGPVPQPVGEITPVPPAASVELAATGADVTWLALGGLLSLVTGTALVLHTTRQRRA